MLSECYPIGKVIEKSVSFCGFSIREDVPLYDSVSDITTTST